MVGTLPNPVFRIEAPAGCFYRLGAAGRLAGGGVRPHHPSMRTREIFKGIVPDFSGRRRAGVALLLAALLSAVPQAGRANVYATNIRLNGSANGAALYIPCGEVQISYLLNEPATAGVTVDILKDTNVVHSISLPGNGPGTQRGWNAVVWDAHDAQGNLVPLDTYTVRVTAASHGYDRWTQISDDFAPGNYVWDPVAITVNRNTNSPWYGRVFVANASPGPNPGFNPGDRVGLLKFNADASAPADGVHSTGGWSWAGDGFSPWKLEVGRDDRLYVNDWSGGAVVQFDQWVSYDSRRLVWRADSPTPDVRNSFGGLALSGDGQESFLWLANAAETTDAGLWRWPLDALGAVSTGDPGTLIVQAGGESDLDQAPYDVAVDVSNRIYVIQHRLAALDPAARLLCFPPYTNGAPPLTNALWKVGSGNNAMRGASGVAVDPTGRYVAVAFAGTVEGNWRTGGRTTVFDAATGEVVTNIITDLPGQASHAHADVAWDQVGNLYDLDRSESLWRVYSPPGSNAASTVATGPLLVSLPPLRPILQALGHANGQFTLALTGRTNASYVIEAAPGFGGWTPVATNGASACPTRVVTVSAPLNQSFYRAYPLP